MDEAEYCHRVAFMYRGRVIALGEPQKLKRELAGHGLLHLDSPALLDSMHALEGVPGVSDVAVFGGGLHVRVDDETAAIPRIREALQSRGVEFSRLEPIQPSLEDVFVSLIETEEKAS